MPASRTFRSSRPRAPLMIALNRLIYMLFNLYALGLVVYSLLSWFRRPGAERARRWLGPYYLPFLDGLHRAIGPVHVGRRMIDLTPGLLLVAILLLRDLVVHLLNVPF